MGAGIVHDAFESIIGTGYIEDITSFFEILINGLRTYFADGSDLSTTLDILRAVGASLMIIYFFIAISDCIQKDILSFDKFVVFIIRLFVGFMVILYLKEIIGGFFQLSAGIYKLISVGNTGQNQLAIPAEEYFEEALKWNDGFIKNFFGHLGTILMMLIINIVGWFGKFAIMMFAISNALMLLARVIFAPVGVAQCFDEGSRSAGIKYLKLLLADMLTYATIIGLLWATNKFSNILLLGVYNSMAEASASLPTAGVISAIPISQPAVLDELVHNTMFIGCAFAIRLAVIGGISKANQLAKEIVGV